MAIEPLAVIGKSYRLLHPIAEGGMGRVWVAEQLILERRVAVKVLTDEIFQSAAGLELFHREARATARVDHPHVIRVLDFDVTTEGVPFLVLELLVGETLEQRILERGVLPLDDAHEVLRQTCDALGFAHECGILHRDIKASNLFLQRRPRVHAIDVKLLDFGIALRLSARGERPTEIAGTPEYMSPEHLRGEDIDERCDLFSLGVATYYALTGQFPFPGEGATEVAAAHAQGTFAPVTTLRSGLPASLDLWFARALAIDRGQRFSTAAGMFEAFEDAIAAHDAPVAIAVSAPPAPARSRLGWAKAGALSAVVAVIVFARYAHNAQHAVAASQPTPSPVVTQTIMPPPAQVTQPPSELPAVATALAPPIETSPLPPPNVNVNVKKPARAQPKLQPRRDAGAPQESSDPADIVIAGTEGFGNRQ